MTKSVVTAFSRRRYLTLVAVLALEDDYAREYGLYSLMKYWGVAWKSEFQLHPDRLISALAKHAVEYHRKDKD